MPISVAVVSLLPSISVMSLCFMCPYKKNYNSWLNWSPCAIKGTVYCSSSISIIFTTTEGTLLQVYKLAVVLLESEQKYLKRNFSIFMATLSVCAGTPATLVTGFLY